MGEYLTINGESVKVGTCENLYYATLKQLKDCGAPGASEYLNPENGYRYRFPFPDERQQIGDYENYSRGVLFSVPKETGIEIMHGQTFFRTDSDQREGSPPPALGFRLPCIQSDGFPVEKYDWSKTAGRVLFEVVQQKIITNPEQIRTEGAPEVQTVVRCPYCGELSRLSADEVESLAGYVGRYPETFSDLQRQIVEIMVEGYGITTPVVFEQ